METSKKLGAPTVGYQYFDQHILSDTHKPVGKPILNFALIKQGVKTEPLPIVEMCEG